MDMSVFTTVVLGIPTIFFTIVALWHYVCVPLFGSPANSHDRRRSHELRLTVARYNERIEGLNDTDASSELKRLQFWVRMNNYTEQQLGATLREVINRENT